MQYAGYNFFENKIKELQPIDILIENGDSIEGKGQKSGGTELIETDRLKQCEMAIQCLEKIKAKKIVKSYGTPFHVGVDEDFEDIVANGLNVEKICSHGWIDVNGIIFDFKHFISSSIIPHGRHTSIARDHLWNQLWSIDESQPLSNVIIRSHTHYHIFNGDAEHLAIITPAMQGFGSKFGTRKCSGKIHIGFIHFDVYNDGAYTWQSHLLRGEFLKERALKL